MAHLEKRVTNCIASWKPQFLNHLVENGAKTGKQKRHFFVFLLGHRRHWNEVQFLCLYFLFRVRFGVKFLKTLVIGISSVYCLLFSNVQDWWMNLLWPNEWSMVSTSRGDPGSGVLCRNLFINLGRTLVPRDGRNIEYVCLRAILPPSKAKAFPQMHTPNHLGLT